MLFLHNLLLQVCQLHKLSVDQASSAIIKNIANEKMKKPLCLRHAAKQYQVPRSEVIEATEAQDRGTEYLLLIVLSVSKNTGTYWGNLF